MRDSATFYSDIRKSFDAALDPAQSTWTNVDDDASLLILHSGSNVAAFAVAGENLERSYESAYATFRAVYTRERAIWQNTTISFVLIRTDNDRRSDALCREIEMDVYFCRKFVLDWKVVGSDLGHELSSLPFYPINKLPTEYRSRPRPVRELINSLGSPAQLTGHITQPGKRAAIGIVDDCLSGKYELKTAETRTAAILGPTESPILDRTRISELSIENFRAYRGRHVFSLDADLIIVYGPNGLGKTSMFEALEFLCTGHVARFGAKRNARTKKILATLNTNPEECNVAGTFMGDSGSRCAERSMNDPGRVTLEQEHQSSKKFLGWLTGVDEAKDRATTDYLERIWRATHYFGQSIQELFSSFKKSGDLSFELIARLLGLEDYVVAHDKLSQGLADLRDRGDAASLELSEAKASIAEMESELAELTKSHESVESTEGILKIAEKLREELATHVDTVLERGNISEDGIRTMRAVAAAARADCSGAISIAQDARTLLDQWLRQEETFKKSLDQQAEDKIRSEALRTQVEAVDSDLKDQRTLEKQQDEEVTALRDKRDALQWFASAGPELNAQSIRIDALTREIEEISKESEIAASKQAELEINIAASKETAVQHESAIARLNSNIERLNTMLARVKTWAEFQPVVDSTTLRVRELTTKLRTRDDQLKKARSIEEERAAAARNAQEVVTATERRQEAVLSALAELESLVDGPACPTCGTQHDSEEALKSKIALVKANREKEQSEALSAFDKANTAYSDAQEARAAIEQSQASLRSEIATLEAGTRNQQIEIDDTRERLAEMTVPQTIHEASAEIRTRLDTLDAEREAGNKALNRAAEAATAMGIEHKSMTKKHEELRVTHGQKVVDLENGIDIRKRIVDEASRRDVDVSDSVAENTQRQGEVQNELELLEKRVIESASLVEQLTAQRGTLLARQKPLEEERERNQQAISEGEAIRSRLSDLLKQLGLPEDCSLEELSAHNESLSAKSQVLEDLHGRIARLELAFEDSKSEAAVSKLKAEIKSLQLDLKGIQARLSAVTKWQEHFSAWQRATSDRRSKLISDYIAVLGPITSMFQSRLRGVYGFGEITLNSTPKTVRVNVEHSGELVAPGDYFSDSQRQIPNDQSVSSDVDNSIVVEIFTDSDG